MAENNYPFPTPVADPSYGETMDQKRSALYQMSRACEDWNQKYTECTDKYYAVKVSSRMTTTCKSTNVYFQRQKLIVFGYLTFSSFIVYFFSLVSHFDLCKDVFKDYKTCLDDHMACWIAYRRFADKAEKVEKQ